MIGTLTAAAADAPGGTWERFEALYRACRDDLYAYVFTLLRDRAAAEDVTAVAFERAYRRRRTFDSLNARIHDAEASIASDEATIRTLNRRINFSQISLSINAATAPAPVAHHSSFTIDQAAHDAGRVLTVAAGVALIALAALAALVPLALVGALALWIAAAVRRRRREQALDAA